MELTHGSLFSGIGGFDLAAEWAGFKNIFHCEWNPFGRQVLEHHFPNTDSYGDITKTDFTKYRGQITVLSGGFPCQPFSVAGKRGGADDDRYLWPEMLRAIKEIRPLWVIVENVVGITNMVQPGKTIRVESEASLFETDSKDVEVRECEFVVETICRDLESIGYTVQPIVIPACAVGAPHRRDRVWFIANTDSSGGIQFREGRSICNEKPDRPDKESEREQSLGFSRSYENGNATNPNQLNDNNSRHDTVQLPQQQAARLPNNRQYKKEFWSSFPTQPPLYARDDGIPRQLAGHPLSNGRWREESVKASGNAIVPQVAYEIFMGIKEIETNKPYL